MSIDINMSVKNYSGTKVESVTTTYNTPSTIANCLSTLMPFNVSLSSNRLSVKPTNGEIDNDEQRQQINLILTHNSDINSHFGEEPSNAHILDDKLKITMIDVDHGDCILIQTPSIPGSPGQNILFDCGGHTDGGFVAESITNSTYNNNNIRIAYPYSGTDSKGNLAVNYRNYIGHYRLTKALNRYGITKIDKLIITHAHEDHDGGLRNSNAVNPARVGCLYDTGLHFTKGLPNIYTAQAANSTVSDYQILRSVSDSKVTKLASISPGWLRQSLSTDSSSIKKITVQNTLDFGGGVTFTVLWPNQKTMDAAALFNGCPSSLKSSMISYIKEKTFGNKSMTFWHDGLEEDVYKNIMLSGSIKGTVTNGTLSANIATLSGNPLSSITASLQSDSTKQYILAKLTGMTLNGIKQNDAFGDSQCWLNSIPSDGTIGGTMQCSVKCKGIGLIGSDFSGTISQGNINLGTFEGHIRNNTEIAVMDDGSIDLNTISIIGKLQYKNFSMLLTGDAIFSSYRRMMHLHDKSKYYGCDVLKGAHHGINNTANINNESLTMASLGHKYVMWPAGGSETVPGIDPENTILRTGRLEHEIIYNKNNKPSGDIPDSIIADGEVKPYHIYSNGYNATLVSGAIVCPRYDASLVAGNRSNWCNPYISTLYAHYKANVPLSNMFTTRFNKDITIITNGYQYSFITAKQLSRWPAILRDSYILSWYSDPTIAAKARPGNSSYTPSIRADILESVRTGNLSHAQEQYNFH